MGVSDFKGDRKIPTENDIKELEKKIEKFCEKKKNKIIDMFNSEFYSEENIEFQIGEKNQIKKIDNGNMLTDFVIQWSIPGKMNSTNCRLTFFNLGSFLGANGFLFSICTFYSYFLNFGSKDQSELDRKGIIRECLNYIDNKDKDKLKEVWQVDINDDILKTLRIAKNFLINNIYMSKNEITEEINRLIENKFYGTWGKIKGFFKKIWMLIIIFFHKKDYKKKEKDYIKFKNNINNKKIFEKIFDLLLNNVLDFKKYNIFILAIDDNTINKKNCYSTFMGYYFKGLGENHKARRLDSDDTDGFMGNGDQLLYSYYWEIIYKIRQFLSRYKERIENINKDLDIECNFSEILKDIDDKTKNNSKIIDNDYSKNGIEEKENLNENLI